MAETHGFTIRLNGEDGKPMTAVFSSVRRTPALGGILKEMRLAQRKYDRLVLERGMYRSRIQALASQDETTRPGETDPYITDEGFASLRAKIDEATAAFEALQDQIETANEQMCELTYQFFLLGFKGAGYTDEIAEKYATACDPNDFMNLRDRAMTGCGVVDFTKRDTN